MALLNKKINSVFTIAANWGCNMISLRNPYQCFSRGPGIVMIKSIVELYVLILAILLSFLLVSCASTERHYNQSVDASGKPGWVDYGTQTSKTSNGRIFLGVGVAKTGGEFARQATAANQQARQEIERMISRFIEVVSRDYIATGAAEPSGYHANEANHYISQMTGIVMPSAKIMEHWVDQQNQKIFAIAELDYPKVVSLLSTSEQVNPGFKVYLKNKGHAVFDRIATQH